MSLAPAAGDPLGHNALIISNDPSTEKRCFPHPAPICFEDLVTFALLSGLSSEIRTIPNAAASSAKSSGGKTDQTNSPGSNSNSNVSPTTTEGRLCFDPAIANRAYFEYQQRGFPSSIRHPEALHEVEYHPICGVDKWIDASQNTATSANTPTATKLVSLKKDLDKATAAANAAPDDQRLKKNVETAQASFNAALNALSSPVSTKISSASSTKAAGAKLAPGLQTLKVVVRTPTGDPVWDVHMKYHYTVVIGTRSTFSIYNFLGRLLNRQDSPAKKHQEHIQYPLAALGTENHDRRFAAIADDPPFAD